MESHYTQKYLLHKFEQSSHDIRWLPYLSPFTGFRVNLLLHLWPQFLQLQPLASHGNGVCWLSIVHLSIYEVSKQLEKKRLIKMVLNHPPPDWKTVCDNPSCMLSAYTSLAYFNNTYLTDNVHYIVKRVIVSPISTLTILIWLTMTLQGSMIQHTRTRVQS